jgi:hypothetical protein
MNDRQRHRVVVTCAVTAGLCLCVTVVAITLGYQLGRQQARRVEAAVEATMGPYCGGPDERMMVYPTNTLLPVGAPIFPTNEWRVFCMTGKTDQPIITVNVERCEARVSTPFREAYTQTLAICP